MAKRFYLTTPIYYVNDVPHLGHAYTTVAADALARYKRLKGYEVFFLTGTDEHGQKVEKAALESGEKPLELADRVVSRFKELWQKLDISHTDFIRTTEERHQATVSLLMRKVKEKGDVYLGDYEDWYCTPCETFITETNLVEGKCPDCGRLVERLREKSYFFRLSHYQQRLQEHIETNPGFIQPQSRRREILSFVSQGLRDLSISRTSFSWGIPVPWDPAHVIYVWFDALSNYLTGVGFGQNEEEFSKFWPADLHIIGKDILRFHSVYWPAFLMSAGLPLPRRIVAHGWWTVEGQKMSKSLGNAVDPYSLAEKYGVDGTRYFLLREVPFGQDGDFSHKAILNRINGDLANDLGNLVNRVVAMVERYFHNVIPEERGEGGQLPQAWAATAAALDNSMEELAFSRGLVSLWQFVNAVNKYLDNEAPWTLAKTDPKGPRLSAVLYNACEALRLVGLILSPFTPGSAKRIWEQLGLAQDPAESLLEEQGAWGGLKPGTKIKKGSAIFPRLEE